MKKRYYKTKTTDDNILDRVDDWMGVSIDIDLCTYLGITEEEHKRWIDTGCL
jgi:hypothetical protein